MEVAHQTDHTSNVIIGGGAAEKFQMAQTGHFFEILSNTLYANGMLAMVREVLCNAWDSHIASGVMGTPVDVSLDANELVFRDYGTGIPHHLVHQIYCVYGNSTKTNDGNQTGGFGLGSKAPFAYTKHFTVTNWHDGTKVVHAISRGTNGDGTPERRVIVDVPTTEQGVEVRIPIKSSQDISTIRHYIENVAKYGEMNVKFNGKKIDRFNLSSSPEGFIISTREDFGLSSNSSVYVRYGNVIYPVEQSGEYNNELREVLEFLSSLPDGNGWNKKTWKICFQAPPNSITVTPARESIQITSVTSATLKQLFSKVSRAKTAYQFQILRDSMVRTATEHYATTYPDKLKAFLDGEAPFTKGSDLDSMGYHKPILTMEDARQRLVRHSFKMGTSDYTLRLKLLADSGIGNEKLLRELVTLLTTHKDPFGSGLWYHDQTPEIDKEGLAYFFKKSISKLTAKIAKTEGMEAKNFYFLSNGSRNRDYDFIEPKDWKPRVIGTVLSYFKNKIFISFSKLAIAENMHELVKEHGEFGLMIGCPAYIVPRRKNAYKDALDFFTKKGWEIVDVDAFVQKHGLNKKPEAEVDLTPKAPKVLGIPALYMLRKPNGDFTPRGHLEYDATGKRVEKPQAVFTPESLAGRDYTHRFFEGRLDTVGIQVLHFIGTVSGIAVNSRQKDKYLGQGAVDGHQYLAEKMFEEFDSNTVLVDYFGRLKLNMGNVESSNIRSLWRASEHMPSIRKLMNYPRQLTADEMYWGNIWEVLDPGTDRHSEDRKRQQWPTTMKTSLHKIEGLIRESKTQPCPERDAIQQRIQSKMFKYIDMTEIITLVSNPTTTQQEKDDAEGVLLLALEG